VAGRPRRWRPHQDFPRGGPLGESGQPEAAARPSFAKRPIPASIAEGARGTSTWARFSSGDVLGRGRGRRWPPFESALASTPIRLDAALNGTLRTWSPRQAGGGRGRAAIPGPGRDHPPRARPRRRRMAPATTDLGSTLWEKPLTGPDADLAAEPTRDLDDAERARLGRRRGGAWKPSWSSGFRNLDLSASPGRRRQASGLDWDRREVTGGSVAENGCARARRLAAGGRSRLCPTTWASPAEFRAIAGGAGDANLRDAHRRPNSKARAEAREARSGSSAQEGATCSGGAAGASCAPPWRKASRDAQAPPHVASGTCSQVGRRGHGAVQEFVWAVPCSKPPS